MERLWVAAPSPRSVCCVWLRARGQADLEWDSASSPGFGRRVYTTGFVGAENACGDHGEAGAGAVSILLPLGCILRWRQGLRSTCIHFTASEAEAPPPQAALSPGEKEDLIPHAGADRRAGKAGWWGVPDPSPPRAYGVLQTNHRGHRVLWHLENHSAKAPSKLVVVWLSVS